MTVKEFYDYVVKHGLENAKILLVNKRERKKKK